MGHGGFICYPECIIHLLFDNLAIYDLGGAVNLFRGILSPSSVPQCVAFPVPGRCPIGERQDVVGWERFKKIWRRTAVRLHKSWIVSRIMINTYLFTDLLRIYPSHKPCWLGLLKREFVRGILYGRWGSLHCCVGCGWRGGERCDTSFWFFP